MQSDTSGQESLSKSTGKEPEQFAEEAARILRTAMRRGRVSYKRLAELLQKSAGGPVESEQALINKVNRGRFSFAFFVRACRAMDVSWVDISSSPDPDSGIRFSPPVLPTPSVREDSPS
jgi:hypothetical protein